MPREIKASVAYTFCSILQKGLSFITLPLFTRLLTTTQYGQYTVYGSWGSIFTIFITMNLAYGTFQTAMIKFKEHRIEYSSSIASIFIVLGAVFSLIYYPFTTFWNKIFELPTIIVSFLIVEIIMTGVTDCWFARNRFEYKYREVVIVTLVKTILSPLLAFFLVMISEEKGYARIIGYGIVNIVFGIVIMIKTYCQGKTFFNKTFWKYAFTFNLPLIPYYISQMIFNASDRIMISKFCGEDKAAIYGVAYSLAIVLTFVINAINDSYAPWFFRKIENREGKENKKISTMLTLIVALGLWIIVAITPEFIKIMAGEKYISGIWAVPPVAASMLMLFYTQLFDRVLFFFEKKYLLILGGIIPSIVNLVLNYFFIPKYGFVAAAYTTLVSYMLFVVINYFSMRHTIKKKGVENDLYSLPKLIGIFIVFVMASIIMMLLYNKIIIRYAIIIVVCIIVFVLRKKIITLFKEVK